MREGGSEGSCSKYVSLLQSYREGMGRENEEKNWKRGERMVKRKKKSNTKVYCDREK